MNMANSKKKPAKTAAKEEKKTSSSTVKALEIPNRTLPLLYQILNVPLHGAQLRARNVFGKMVRARIASFEDARIESLESYAKRDPADPTKFAYIRNEQTGVEEYDISPKDLEEHNATYNELMADKLIIDLTPSTKPIIALMKPLVLESKMPLSTTDGYVYEEICTAFEAI